MELSIDFCYRASVVSLVASSGEFPHSNGVNASAADRHDVEVAPVSSSMSLPFVSFDRHSPFSHKLVNDRSSYNNQLIPYIRNKSLIFDEQYMYY